MRRQPQQTYQIAIEPTAWKQIMALPLAQQERVLSAIEQLEPEPRPAGCKKLAGQTDLYRIRVTDFRIIYQIRDSELLILIVKVGHRRDVYR